MRILFLTHYFPPEGNAPASRVFELCRHWVKAGHQVTVITGAPNVPDGKVYDGYKNRLYQREEMDGIRVIRVWTYLAPNKGTVRRIVNFVSYMITALFAGCLTRRPDVVIATSPQFFCGWAGALVSTVRRKPFILEIRDLWPESIKVVGAMRNGRLITFLEWLEKRLYASADHIVTVGEGYQRQLQERGVPAARISVIMNGVDRDLFTGAHSGAEIRRKYNLEGKYVCSYSGTVGMACGLEIVLRAAAKAKATGNSELVFMIVGDGASLETLRQAAETQGLTNVIFTGRQPKGLMPEFLAATDACLVHLKKQDLFATVMPSKIFESLAMCKPVVLGVEGFAADFIRKSGGGICIEPENDEQLLGAIAQLRSQPQLGNKMGQDGRDYVLKNFDRGMLAQKYLEQIRTVLGARQPQRLSPAMPERVATEK